MSEFTRKDICEGVAFSSITDNRFKIGRISSTLAVPLDRKTAAANALLSCVLTRSCKKYPDFTALSRKLNSLYGASLYPSVRKIGEYQALTISISGLDDKYSLDGKSISAELAELLCSIIFNPNVTDGRFTEDDVEQERRQLLENIDAEFNDKRLYAIKRCIENMCRDERYSVGPYGNHDEVEALTHGDIYSAWENLLKSARVELTMLGSADPQNAFEGFRKNFENKPRRFEELKYVQHEPSEVRRFAETEEVSQSKLVMGFRCNHPETAEERVANSLMSAILGGTPTSKLFANVREKMSLCYYCASRIDNQKGILLIDSGVETANIDKTEKAVLEQLEDLKKGVITDEEISSARLALKNAFISSLDSLAAMQSYYISGIVSGSSLSPLKAAELVDGITKEKVVELARKVKLDTVFSLIGN